MTNTEKVLQSINKRYDNIPPNILSQIENSVKNVLVRSGIIHRIFSRVKSKESILNKMESKAEKYISRSEKMQDLFGIRIILYFEDDIDICIRLLNQAFSMVNNEHDDPEPDIFRAKRINYVYKIPENYCYLDNSFVNECLIDKTFEIQIRSILSEGWLEVEHDIRYKHKEDWFGIKSLSREMNGILAALELCDNYIVLICDKLSKKQFEKKEWEAMMRSHFRLNFIKDKLSDELCKILLQQPEIARKIYQYDRSDLINLFFLTRLPRTYNNAIYLINLDEINNPEINELTSEVVLDKYKNIGE